MALFSPRFKNNMRLQTAAQNSPPLKMGETGMAVQLLQEALTTLRYELPRSLKKDGTLDGVYGLETAKVVEAFQRNNGLVADKSAGEKTLAMLDSYFLPDQQPPPIPIPKQKGRFTHKISIDLRVTLLSLLAGNAGPKPMPDQDPLRASAIWTNPWRQFYNAKNFFERFAIHLSLHSRARLQLSLADELKLMDLPIGGGGSDINADLQSLFNAGPPVAPTSIAAFFVALTGHFFPNSPFPPRVITSTSQPGVLISVGAFPQEMELTRAIFWLLLGPSIGHLSYSGKLREDFGRGNIMYPEGCPSAASATMSEEQWKDIQKSPLLKKI